jgi:threonine dehydrogenase-like Zn-dependent dehydrogenase
MMAVVLRAGIPELVDRPEPAPRPDEATVRVLLAGICRTDLEIARGYMTFDGVPGHEFVGVVEESGDPAWVGRRVVGEINASCGACETCREGWPRHCPRRTVLGISGRDGAFAERLALPVANLHEVPAGMSDESAVFTEPLAAAHEILEQVSFGPRARVLVLGDGRLGQLCVAVLRRAGVSPTVSGRHAKKLERLARIGCPIVDAVRPIPREFDIAVEATGTPDGLRRALSAVRPRGTVVLKSTYHGGAQFDLSGLVIDEITLLGSRCGPFAPALEHLRDDPSCVEGLVTARFPLSEARDAFARAMDASSLKVLLEP